MSSNPYSSPSSDLMPAPAQEVPRRSVPLATMVRHIFASGASIIIVGIVGACLGYVFLSYSFAWLMWPPDPPGPCGMWWILPCSIAILVGGFSCSLVGIVVAWRLRPWRRPKYERISVKCTRGAMAVSFLSPRIETEAETQQVGRELISVLDVAAKTRAPVVVSFRGVEAISSAFIGRLVVFHKRAKDAGVPWRLAEVSGAVLDVFRRVLPGDGPAGVVTVLKPPPKNDGGCASPPDVDDDDQ